jgi:Kef-type K+ transport system membrane component KefB
MFPALAALPLAAAGGLGHRMSLLVLQLAVILLVAKVVGELFERFLKQPAVLGELVAGMAIGPYALGRLALPGLGPLFPRPGEGTLLPVSPELWGIAQLASIVLLFVVGLETDFRMFVRYSFPGLLVGLGGVLGSFFLGAAVTVAFGLAPHLLHPEALFLGTISVATSVGITARILSEKRRLDSPEGTTILAGAVIDDVLGIIVLAIVGGIAAAEVASGGAAAGVDWRAIGGIAGRAVGFWVGATGLLVLLASIIARTLGLFRSAGAGAAVAFGVALLFAGLAESVGLAMIIGAYIVGLALSKERIAKDLVESLRALYVVLVPIFFCVMGMIVELSAIRASLGFGLVYTAVAIVSKVAGCGLPTFLVGFNLRGALRVGIGMLPRGEVALIVAGAAISHEPPYIGADVFGVAILMTIITTLLAPPLIVKTFASAAPGLRRPPLPPPVGSVEGRIAIAGLGPSVRAVARDKVIASFERAGYSVSLVSTDPEIFRIVRGDSAVDLHAEGDRLILDSTVVGTDDVAAIAAAGLHDAREALERAAVVVLPANELQHKT